MHHLEFPLKYDDLNLYFLKAVFEKIPFDEIIAFIESSRSGKYTHKIGFLFKFFWLLHQNKGVLPKRSREKFAKLTDEEIAKM